MTAEIDFELLKSKDPKIKYGFAKKLLELVRLEPQLLYPYFSQFVDLLKSENKIIKWTAIDIIGLLAMVDKENKVDGQVGPLISILSCGNLITVNHAIFSLGKIAEVKPQFLPVIITELLKIEHYNFETTECRNIAAGKVIETFGSFIDAVNNDKRVLDFTERATHNTRNATKKKALLLLRKLEKAKAYYQPKLLKIG